MELHSEMLVRSAGAVAHALEVQRGWFARHGVRLGDVGKGVPIDARR